MRVKAYIGGGQTTASAGVRRHAHPVVALGYMLWRQRFNADAGVVGETIYLNGQPFIVIGVMPESFLGLRYYLAGQVAKVIATNLR
jgi:hypothetical protein